MKKKLLLTLIAVASLGCVTTATALIVKNANMHASGSVEGTVVLSWGGNVVSNITDLSPDSPSFRTVIVNAADTTESTGSQKVTFTLGGTKTDGISVEVSKGASVAEAAPVVTLDSTNATHEDTCPLDVSTSYYLKVSITQESFDTLIAANDSLDAKLTINLAYVA